MRLVRGWELNRHAVGVRGEHACRRVPDAAKSCGFQHRLHVRAVEVVDAEVIDVALARGGFESLRGNGQRAEAEKAASREGERERGANACRHTPHGKPVELERT
jgi:hypothetical protein